MHARLVVVPSLFATLCVAFEAPLRPASYGAFHPSGEGEAGDVSGVWSSRGGGETSVPNRYLSLEAEELGGLAPEAEWETRRAWWGNEDRPSFGHQVGAGSGPAVERTDVASGAELRRMGHLMRRQLQPRWFVLSYSFYAPTQAPTVATPTTATEAPVAATTPTLEPTALPTPFPSPLPTPLPTAVPTELETAAPTSYPTPSCGGADENIYRFELQDSGGDGWEGATYTITDSTGAVVASGTLDEGDSQVEVLCLADGQYTITFGGGADDGETSVAFLPVETQFTDDCLGPCEFDVILSGGVSFEGTAVPTAAPTDSPSTPAPSTATPLPTTLPPTVAPTLSPVEVTFAPTTSDASQPILLISQITVSGIDDDDFADDGILVVQFALNDVISWLTDPNDVVDATVEITRRRLQAGNFTATIEYSVFVESAGSIGFTSSDDALEDMETQVSDASADGTLAERINYWANYFGSDFNPVPDDDQDPDGEWVFAPTAAPTPLTPFPTTATPTTASPTGSPKPTTGPTTSPVAVVTPTLAPSTTAPVLAPTTAPVAPTAAPVLAPTPPPVVDTPLPTVLPTPTPVAPRPDGGKKSSNNNTALIAIIIVVCVVVIVCLAGCGYLYMKNRERKLTERKDSWDISTMFTDEANLPDAEEMIEVEPEGGAIAEGGADEADVTDTALVEVPDAGQGGDAGFDEYQPQVLQKITHAEEL